MGRIPHRKVGAFTCLDRAVIGFQPERLRPVPRRPRQRFFSCLRKRWGGRWSYITFTFGWRSISGNWWGINTAGSSEGYESKELHIIINY